MELQIQLIPTGEIILPPGKNGELYCQCCTKVRADCVLGPSYFGLNKACNRFSCTVNEARKNLPCCKQDFDCQHIIVYNKSNSCCDSNENPGCLQQKKQMLLYQDNWMSTKLHFCVYVFIMYIHCSE